MIRVVLLSETESLVNPEKMPLLREAIGPCLCAS